VIGKAWYCDGPGCEVHTAPILSRGHFLVVSMPGEPRRHFCGWDCVMKYGATREPDEIIPFHPEADAA
jgi:hypothetical protein